MALLTPYDSITPAAPCCGPQRILNGLHPNISILFGQWGIGDYWSGFLLIHEGGARLTWYYRAWAGVGSAQYQTLLRPYLMDDVTPGPAIDIRNPLAARTTNPVTWWRDDWLVPNRRNDGNVVRVIEPGVRVTLVGGGFLGGQMNARLMGAHRHREVY